ncbi:hypothetical protein RQP46_001372 [Phenoliferia psychrophenolica]
MSDIWRGSETLVLALDIGTTQSAASIVHLVPNMPIKVRVVNRWPGSPDSSKIPTSILYDDQGKARAIGAETKDEALEDQDLTECKWFKLHVHPAAMQPPPIRATSGNATGHTRSPFEIPPLPTNVTVEQVYSDFIQYLFNNAKTWFETNAPDGEEIWRRNLQSFKLVIAHPNSWGMREQAFLKRAVKKSGICVIASDTAANQVVFVTESEASVHFSLAYTGDEKKGWLSPGSTFAVVDAGGSTVDVCVYAVKETSPKLLLREFKTSDCTQSGAIFISRAAESIIKEKLGESKYNTPEFVAAMVAGFDTKTKIAFDSVEDNYIIKFGFDRDMDKAVGISRGRLTLTGAEVKRAFDPCVDMVIESVRDQISGMHVKSILLVGGFGESPYLRRRLRETFERSGAKVITADEPTKKAVAEGGALFFSKDNIVARATRFEFGISTIRDYEEWKHQRGNRHVSLRGSGRWSISGGWSTIVKNRAIIDTDQVLRQSFHNDFRNGDYMLYEDLLSYSGRDGNTAYGGWCTNTDSKLHPNFAKVCTIKADLSKLAATEHLKINPVTNETYKNLIFDVCLVFGGTSLRAEIRWMIKGVEHRSEASVVPSSFF